ncbi:MAG: TlpA family protein disulfide reductase [Flavobacterium sp.]
MKKLFCNLVGILSLGLIGCQAEAQTQFTEAALQEKLLSLDGKEITLQEVLKQYEGKTVVVDIWASWCPDCIKGMPKVHELQKHFPEVVYLFLSYDKTEESWKKGIEKYEVKGEHYLIRSNWKGGGFKDEVKIDWIPRYMVLDQNSGIALFRAIEADDPKMLETIQSLQK